MDTAHQPPTKGGVQPQPNAPKMHPMVVLQPGERIIAEIKRHPFGIIGVYIAGLLAVMVAVALVVMAPTLFVDYDADGGMTTLMTVGVSIFIVVIGLILTVATVVYWQNRWIVTDDSITQITQDSLFGRRVSQLAMESLEDITVDQHGILPTLFNYGTLKAETAGEHSKFAFPFCPQPNKYARLILEVHETFLHQRRHAPQPVNPITPVNGPHYGQQAVYQHPVQPQPMPQQIAQTPPQNHYAAQQPLYTPTDQQQAMHQQQSPQPSAQQYSWQAPQTQQASYASYPQQPQNEPAFDQSQPQQPMQYPTPPMPQQYTPPQPEQYRKTTLPPPLQ